MLISESIEVLVQMAVLDVANGLGLHVMAQLR